MDCIVDIVKRAGMELFQAIFHSFVASLVMIPFFVFDVFHSITPSNQLKPK